MDRQAIAFLTILLPMVWTGTALGAQPRDIGSRLWVNPAESTRLWPNVKVSPDGDYFEERVGTGPVVVTNKTEKSGVTWYELRFDTGVHGWIEEGILRDPALFVSVDPKVSEAKRQKEIEDRKRRAEDMRNARIDAQSWPQQFKELVRQRNIGKGMRPDMVKMALGQPTRIVEEDIGSVRREQWFYGRDMILYFENDVLIGWRRER